MVRVCELMVKEVITIEAERTALESVRMMAEKEHESLVVLEHGRPAGMVTERDLVRRIVAEGQDPTRVRVSGVMSKPLITIDPDAQISAAARVMMESKVRRLPVIKDGKLVGMLTSTDYVRFLCTGFTDYYKVIMRYL